MVGAHDYVDTMRSVPPLFHAPPQDTTPSRRAWLDVFGADSALRAKTLGYGLVVAWATFLAGMILSLPGGGPRLVTVLALLSVSLVLGAVCAYIGGRVGEGGGAVAQAFIQPSGNSTPYEQTFSYQEAMIMRGEINEALESYEAIIAEHPGTAAPRLRAAEHYAKGNRNPLRAAELFREVRSIPDVAIRDAIYASSRLVDLYDGPLADPGRALVELRRIIELYPGSAVATHARAALPALKKHLESERVE